MTIVNETTFSVFFAKSISPLTDESLLAWSLLSSKEQSTNENGGETCLDRYDGK